MQLGGGRGAAALLKTQVAATAACGASNNEQQHCSVRCAPTSINNVNKVGSSTSKNIMYEVPQVWQHVLRSDLLMLIDSLVCVCGVLMILYEVRCNAGHCVRTCIECGQHKLWLTAN